MSLLFNAFVILWYNPMLLQFNFLTIQCLCNMIGLYRRRVERDPPKGVEGTSEKSSSLSYRYESIRAAGHSGVGATWTRSISI